MGRQKKEGRYVMVWLTPEDSAAIDAMSLRDLQTGGPGTRAQVFRNMLLWLRSEAKRLETEQTPS